MSGLSMEEAAYETGLDLQEINRMQSLGILPKKERFIEEDLETLSAIGCLRKLGLSIEELADLGFTHVMLSEIFQYLGTAPLPTSPETCLTVLGSARTVFRAHLDTLKLQIQQLHGQQEALEQRLKVLDRLASILYEKQHSC